MRRSHLAVLLLMLTALAGCEVEQSAGTARIPEPPVPLPRRLMADLKLLTTMNSREVQETNPNSGSSTSPDEPPLLTGKPLSDRVAEANGQELLKLFGPTYAGNEFDWKAYRGNVVMVVFWASWSPNCRESLLQLEKITEFVRSKKFTIVTVNIDEDATPARAMLKTLSLPFETIIDSEQAMALNQEYPTTHVPTIVVVDKAGMITKLKLNAADFISELRRLIGEPYAGPVGKLPLFTKRRGGSTSSTTAAKSKSYDNISTAESEEGLVEAKAGSGKKGRGYGGDIYTEPLKARWTVEQKLIFDVQIPRAMQLFQSTHDRFPNSHEEFMTEIVEASAITLPELPEGNTYVYLPEQGKLMIREAAK